MIVRAQTVLAGLEHAETLGRGGATRLADDLPLFAANQPHSDLQQEGTKPSFAEKALAEIFPDTLSPREALDLIYRLKAEVENYDT